MATSYYFLACLAMSYAASVPMSEEASSECATSTKIPDKIHITTIEYWPYYRQSRERGADVCVRSEGFIADVVARLANMVGFEYEFSLVKDSKYGMKTPVGTWSGMIGEVQRKEADLAAAPITVSSKRLEAVDFTLPLLRSGVVILYKKPGNNEVLPFTDIKSLLEAEIPVGTTEGSSTAHMLSTTQDKDLLRLWLAMRRHNKFPKSTQEGLDLVRQGNYAFLTEKDSAILAERTRPCDIAIVGDTLMDKDYALAVSIGSPLRAPLNKALAEMHEKGEITQLFNKHWEDQCSAGN